MASPSAMKAQSPRGMGVDCADFDNSGKPGIIITNFDNEMLGLYRSNGKSFDDVAMQAGLGPASRNTLGFGCVFFDADLDGRLELAVATATLTTPCATSAATVGYAQSPQLFLNQSNAKFLEVAAELGGGFASIQSRPAVSPSPISTATAISISS